MLASSSWFGRFTGVLIWPFVHTAAALVPGNQYFATHPEYYSLVGGKLGRQAGGFVKAALAIHINDK
jgi:hypothetical protein